MAYRAPLFSYQHAFRDAYYDYGGDVSASHSINTDHPLHGLFDNRLASLCQFAASQTDPYFQVDLGGGPETGFNRLIIPKDHDISELKVEQADDEAFTTNVETLHASDSSITIGTIYDSGEFDTAASTRRHIRVTMVGTFIYYLPELYLTKLVSLTVGPDHTKTVDMQKSNATLIEQPTGLTMAVQHGSNQRVIEYEFTYPLESADITAVEALAAYVGTHRPFYLSPASFSATPDADDPPLFVRFTEMPRLQYGPAANLGVEAKTATMTMLESLD